MSCNLRILYLKIKSALLLLIIFTCLILLITIVSHRPSILKRMSYRYAQPKNYPKRMPGDYLKDYTPSNESYCKFNYNLPEDFVFDENDLKSTPELGQRSSHKVLYNIIEPKQQNYNSTAPVMTVTYATHVTPDFLRYISEIVRYWDGVVSLAAFVPDFDADTVTKLMMTLCQCLPEMSRISVHYVFPKNKPPFIETGTKVPSSCKLTDISSLVTFRYQNKLAYPVNVCRNVARNAAFSKYVLVSDVELIPSENLAGSFLSMIRKLRSNSRYLYPSKVFVVPVFEIDSYENIPRNKEDIKGLVNEEKAVYFHRYICSHCQRFPGLERWFQTPDNSIKVMVEL